MLFWLNVLIMSRTSFRVNPQSIVCLNVKELLARSRRHIWSLCDSNVIRTHNHLIRKRTLNHLASLAKWLRVRLRIKWLWVRITLLVFFLCLLFFLKNLITVERKDNGISLYLFKINLIFLPNTPTPGLVWYHLEYDLVYQLPL